MIKGLEHGTREEHRRLSGDFINVHKYLMEEVQKIHLNTEKPFIHEETLTVRVNDQWSLLLREVMESFSLERLKTQLE